MSSSPSRSALSACESAAAGLDLSGLDVGASHAEEKLACLLRVLPGAPVVEPERVVVPRGGGELPEVPMHEGCRGEQDSPSEHDGGAEKREKGAYAREGIEIREEEHRRRDDEGNRKNPRTDIEDIRQTCGGNPLLVQGEGVWDLLTAVVEVCPFRVCHGLQPFSSALSRTSPIPPALPSCR